MGRDMLRNDWTWNFILPKYLRECGEYACMSGSVYIVLEMQDMFLMNFSRERKPGKVW